MDIPNDSLYNTLMTQSAKHAVKAEVREPISRH